jgi:hypothetical protein
MVIAAFIIASLAIIVALGAFQGAQKAQQEKTRQQIAEAVSSFLADSVAPDAEHAEGRLGEAHVKLSLGHYEITFEVKLPPAMVPYPALVDRFANRALRERLAEFQLEVAAGDIVRGAVPREPSLGETLVTISKRLELIDSILGLRRHAPSVLLESMKTAHDTRQIDEVLLALSYTYPTAPETEEAIEWAAHLEHSHPERIRERAAQWLSAGRQPAYPVR